jgi:hypothetical protein
VDAMKMTKGKKLFELNSDEEYATFGALQQYFEAMYFAN